MRGLNRKGRPRSHRHHSKRRVQEYITVTLHTPPGATNWWDVLAHRGISAGGTHSEPLPLPSDLYVQMASVALRERAPDEGESAADRYFTEGKHVYWGSIRESIVALYRANHWHYFRMEN